jgi:hypothetical protein
MAQSSHATRGVENVLWTVFAILLTLSLQMAVTAGALGGIITFLADRSDW